MYQYQMTPDEIIKATSMGSKSNNNYASCYALPISTPKSKPKSKIICEKYEEVLKGRPPSPNTNYQVPTVGR